MELQNKKCVMIINETLPLGLIANKMPEIMKEIREDGGLFLTDGFSADKTCAHRRNVFLAARNTC